MSKEKPTTKLCKHCKSEIPYDAKVCPHCRKKQKGGILKWIVLIFVLLLIIGAFSGGDKKTKKIGDVSNSQKTTGEIEASKKTMESAANSNSENDVTESASQEISDTQEIKTVYNVGDILEDGDLEIVYMSSGEHVEDNQFLQPAEGKKYIFIQLAFINNSKKSDATVSMFNFECYADGYNAEMYYGGDENLSSTLSAGRSTSGYLYFEVPQDAQNIEIEYTPNYFTSDKITFTFEGDKDSGYVLDKATESTEGALAVGESTESSALKISYLSCARDESGNQFITPKAGYHYITCEFEFENLSSSDETVTFYSFDCFADGIACEAAYYRDDALSATISSGRKAKGTVTFEVPDDAQIVEVEYLSNYWTSNRVVFDAKA